MSRFTVGEVYIRRELQDEYGGQRYGGISTPAKHDVILLFTGEQGSAYGYEDRFEDDGLFHYTGEGQIGDMKMDRGNLAILKHQQRNKDLHLFKYVSSANNVMYLGRAFYAGHRERPAPDRLGNMRKAIVFELLIDTPADGVAELEPEFVPQIPKKLLRKSLEDLRKEAFAPVNENSTPKERRAVAYTRSKSVKAYVLLRAGGICEGCGNTAPFLTRLEEPYLEPHHIRRRADNGPDNPLWVIALCPNCHARVHYGKDGREYNAYLARRVATIEHEHSSFPLDSGAGHLVPINTPTPPDQTPTPPSVSPARFASVRARRGQ
jgi:5-methylcytosine-specific restriction protein A